MTDPKHTKPVSQTPSKPGPAERPTSEESIGRSRRTPSAHSEEAESSRAWIWGVVALIALIAGGAVWMYLTPEGQEEAQVLEQAKEDMTTPPEQEAIAGPEAPAPTAPAEPAAEAPPPAAEAPSEVGEVIKEEAQVLEQAEVDMTTPPEQEAIAGPVPPPPPAPAEPAAEVPPPAEPAAPAAAPAEPTTVAAAAPETYTVARGDTLGRIAAKLYGDVNKWRAIAEANPGVNANRLTVGQVLKLPSDLEVKQQ